MVLTCEAADVWCLACYVEVRGVSCRTSWNKQFETLLPFLIIYQFSRHKYNEHALSLQSTWYMFCIFSPVKPAFRLLSVILSRESTASADINVCVASARWSFSQLLWWMCYTVPLPWKRVTFEMDMGRKLFETQLCVSNWKRKIDWFHWPPPWQSCKVFKTLEHQRSVGVTKEGEVNKNVLWEAYHHKIFLYPAAGFRSLPCLTEPSLEVHKSFHPRHSFVQLVFVEFSYSVTS